MTRYKPGDLVLVRFPFTDYSILKKRPALVLSASKFTAQQGDVVVMALTSQPQRDVLTPHRMEGGGPSQTDLAENGCRHLGGFLGDPSTRTASCIR